MKFSALKKDSVTFMAVLLALKDASFLPTWLQKPLVSNDTYSLIYVLFSACKGCGHWTSNLPELTL